MVPWSAEDGLDLEGYRNTLLPPKEIFFPRWEPMLRYSGWGRNLRWEEVRAPSAGRPAVLFGVRPCDARSLTVLDAVFQDDHPDPYYLQRRRAVVVVVLACTTPGRSCFCADVGGGPADERGADVMAAELEGEIRMWPVTDKGAQLLAETGWEPDPGGRELLEQHMQRTPTPAHGVPAGRYPEALEGRFEDPVWDRLHLPCLGCASCTYLCPTCHCFDVADETSDGGGLRVRGWDSCMFALYTLHASGHNPRPSVKERFRNRFMHKLSYFPKRYGLLACVGCGRCVEHCPVNVDVREVMKELVSDVQS